MLVQILPKVRLFMLIFSEVRRSYKLCSYKKKSSPTFENASEDVKDGEDNPCTIPGCR